MSTRASKAASRPSTRPPRTAKSSSSASSSSTAPIQKPPTTSTAPPPGKQPPSPPPTHTPVAVAGRRDEVDPLAQATRLVLHERHQSPGQTGDVCAAAAPRQLDLRVLWRADDARIDVAEAVDLGSAD